MLLDENIKAAKQKYADEVNDLKTNVRELEEEILRKREKMNQLEECADRHEIAMQEKEAEMAHLKTEIQEAHMRKQEGTANMVTIQFN